VIVQYGTGEILPDRGTCLGEGLTDKRERETVGSQEEVRGGHSTHDEGDNITPSREGPLLRLKLKLRR
jgi:hypothetical protein